MVLIDNENTGKAHSLIPLHFDVPKHELSLDEFIDAAQGTRTIVENFNQELFGGKLKYKIIVIPPKPGTFLELLSISLIGVASYKIFQGFWSFINSDIGKAYIRGLTEREVEEIAEQAGAKTREWLQKLSNPNKEIKSSDVPDEEMKFISIILVQITIGFLRKAPGELQRIGLSKEKYRLAYNARNRIYQNCMDNREIEGLGFDTQPNFPIRREDFPKYLVDVPPEEEPEEDHVWTVETKDILVNSPNWKRDSRRKWQAECGEEKDIAFTIEDEMFWHLVRTKDIDPEINDSMTVQWAYPYKNYGRANVQVLKVLRYNGREVSPPLSDAELSEILDQHKVKEDTQRRLFD